MKKKKNWRKGLKRKRANKKRNYRGLSKNMS